MSSSPPVKWQAGGALSDMSRKHNQKFRQKQRERERMEKEKAGAFEFVQKINWILAKIRESDTGIMETTQKNEGDSSTKATISRVLFPPEGGVLTCFDNHEHPAKGFCYGETVETVDEVKKTLMSFLNAFVISLAQSKIKTILFVLLFRKQFKTILESLICKLDYRMRRVRQKPIMYCRCVREVYRVSNLMMIWYPDYKTIMESGRNIICMGLEYDDAYRYPFQDIVVEFDREKGKENIVKEMKRLMDLLIQRDSRPGPAARFKNFRKMLFLLNFNKNLKEMLKRFFLELNLEEIKLDEADLYHAKIKPNYMWEHKNEKEEKEEEKI